MEESLTRDVDAVRRTYIDIYIYIYLPTQLCLHPDTAVVMDHLRYRAADSRDRSDMHPLGSTSQSALSVDRQHDTR